MACKFLVTAGGICALTKTEPLGCPALGMQSPSHRATRDVPLPPLTEIGICLFPSMFPSHIPYLWRPPTVHEITVLPAFKLYINGVTLHPLHDVDSLPPFRVYPLYRINKNYYLFI